MPTRFLSSQRRNYGYCYCTSCNGSIRDRRTIRRHKDNVQTSFGKGCRVCHCSFHPLGAIVHRHTLRKHISRDYKAGRSFELQLGTDGLAELLETDNDLQIIEDIRSATYLTQELPTIDDDDDSDEDQDDGKAVDSDNEDADELDIEEEMDIQENEDIDENFDASSIGSNNFTSR